MAERAISLAAPSIRRVLSEDAKRPHLHVIVGIRDPAGPYWSRLAERSFGDVDAWEHEYDAIAGGKFDLSGRTGLDSRVVQLTRPDLLEPGDIMFWGSVVRGTIVVAGSGVESYFDEAFAESIAGYCRALIQHELERLRKAAELVGGDRYDGQAAARQ
jgi:hypothetical protein